LRSLQLDEHCGSLAKPENQKIVTPRRNRRRLPTSFYSNCYKEVLVIYAATLSLADGRRAAFICRSRRSGRRSSLGIPDSRQANRKRRQAGRSGAARTGSGESRSQNELNALRQAQTSLAAAGPIDRGARSFRPSADAGWSGLDHPRQFQGGYKFVFYLPLDVQLPNDFFTQAVIVEGRCGTRTAA
jgi:hypothetical protein